MDPFNGRRQLGQAPASPARRQEGGRGADQVHHRRMYAKAIQGASAEDSVKWAGRRTEGYLRLNARAHRVHAAAKVAVACAGRIELVWSRRLRRATVRSGGRNRPSPACAGTISMLRMFAPAGAQIKVKRNGDRRNPKFTCRRRRGQAPAALHPGGNERRRLAEAFVPFLSDFPALTVEPWNRAPGTG